MNNAAYAAASAAVIVSPEQAEEIAAQRRLNARRELFLKFISLEEQIGDPSKVPPDILFIYRALQEGNGRLGTPKERPEDFEQLCELAHMLSNMVMKWKPPAWEEEQVREPARLAG